MSKTVSVRFGQGLRWDWEGRDVYPYAWDTGTLLLTAEQTTELLDDLRHYSDRDSSDMDSGTRQLYVRGFATLTKAINKGE
jgi:hypothetical protein